MRRTRQFWLILPTKPGPLAEPPVCSIAWRQAAAYRSNVASRSAKVLIFAGLCLTTLLLPACGSNSTPADSVVSANQRLGGSWRLQTFSPATPLDLPLQAVLSGELGQLIVTFNQGTFSAAGPGLNFNGRYEITSASGEMLSLLLFDPQGVGYHFAAQFVGDELHFQSTDKPWVGVGTFKRG
jgi:hypothetical protein